MPVSSLFHAHRSRRVCLHGFSEFERATLDSYFRLAGGPMHDYQLVDTLEGCELIIANADAAQALYTIGRAGRVRDTLFVGGGSVPSSCAAHLSRPIDVMQIRRALEHIERRRTSSARPPARPSAHVRQMAQEDLSVQDFHSSSGFSNSVLLESEARLDDVLVVTSSPAERSMLRPSLSRFGYRITLATTADEALVCARQQSFAFIFLGIDRNGLNSLHIARRLRRSHQQAHGTSGARAPVLVVLSSQSGAISRIRATFAGCDAYLPVPLEESDLQQLLARHDSTFERVFEPTAPMPC